jgi:hypothetical protein
MVDVEWCDLVTLRNYSNFIVWINRPFQYINFRSSATGPGTRVIFSFTGASRKLLARKEG